MSWTTTTRLRLVSISTAKESGVPTLSRDQLEPSETSDEILLGACANGGQEALAVLFRRYYGLLRVICLRILRDEAEADDLVQDVFLFIHNEAAIYDSSKSTARSWIVQMAYRRAISRRRYLDTRGHYRNIDSSPLRDPGRFDCLGYDYSIEALLGRDRLKVILEALSDEQFETLRLHFYEGYTLVEISEKLGQSLGNIRHHYYRGLEKFRKEILGSKLLKP